MSNILFLTGLADEYPATTDDGERSIEALKDAWFKRSEDHHLNRYEDMSLTLRAMFPEQFSAWVPYLFVYIGNRIRHATPEQERTLLAFLKNMERCMFEKEYMQAVGFRYVGSL